MNISRIVLGLLLIVGAGGALVGGTSAFFSDTETSTGNSFTAGAIDLKVDNDSYYNGNRCALDTLDVDGDQNFTEYVWQGNAGFPVVGTTCTTSWALTDLDGGQLFFNFTDVKPDDEGEDTISLHVNTNDAYACMDLTLTSDNDVSSVEPELGDGDVPEDVNDTWDGELADTIQMFWWADDGDNVYETGEPQVTPGVQTITAMFGQDLTFTATLADSQSNIWGIPGPIQGDTTVYIAKAWCMGTMTLTPVTAGLGVNPSVASGVSCDGSALNNLTQTDSTTMDISFRTIQSRNNPNYLCGNDQPRTATITVTKVIVNDNGGNNVVADYQLFVDNGVVATPVTSGVATAIASGAYTIGETGVPGYVASFSGDCDANGQISLAPGESKSCTITNNDLPANITLIKSVINNNGGIATATQFGLRVDGGLVQNNTSVAVTSNAPHSINEDGRVGYTFVSITGSAQCPLVLGGTATLNEGEAITCTITNDDN